ncbi:MAG: YceI family protein [Pyrinomonadaceae bacterium]
MKLTKTLFLTVVLGLFAVLQSGASAGAASIAERFGPAAGGTQQGESGVYNFDRAHTFIGFKVKHMGLIEVPGFFRDFTGKISYDAADVTRSSVEFAAKVTSIDTGVAGRDNHLRSKDFFEVETYPEMTFKSTRVTKKGKNLMITGDLTLKGVTRSITFPFEIAGFVPGNERSGMRMGVTAETIINRRDYGVNYDSKLPNGTPSVDDSVKVVLAIEAVMPKAAAAPKSE